MSGLQIGPLLSTCIDACQRGCTEVRRVQASRSQNSLSVELKDASDPRSALTEADEAAHVAIVGGLRAEWGSDLLIVGEEDGDEKLESKIASRTFAPFRRDMLEDDIGETAEIDPSEITIFVDPLDGTREFVEERLENCQVLVGIAIGGEAVAGAIGIPFPAGNLDVEPTIVYGISHVGSGLIGSPLTRGPFPLDHHIDGIKYPRPHHATGDSSVPLMVACRETVVHKFHGSTVVYGGAGNKILGTALGEVVCSIQHKVGGPWDLCAPQAVLKAMGGQMTNLFGEEIDFRDSDCGGKGYLASTPGSEDTFHESLVAVIGALPEVQAHRK